MPSYHTNPMVDEESAPYAQELFSNENYVYTSAIAMKETLWNFRTGSPS